MKQFVQKLIILLVWIYSNVYSVVSRIDTVLTPMVQDNQQSRFINGKKYFMPFSTALKSSQTTELRETPTEAVNLQYPPIILPAINGKHQNNVGLQLNAPKKIGAKKNKDNVIYDNNAKKYNRISANIAKKTENFKPVALNNASGNSNSNLFNGKKFRKFVYSQGNSDAVKDNFDVVNRVTPIIKDVQAKHKINGQTYLNLPPVLDIIKGNKLMASPIFSPGDQPNLVVSSTNNKYENKAKNEEVKKILPELNPPTDKLKKLVKPKPTTIIVRKTSKDAVKPFTRFTIFPVSSSSLKESTIGFVPFNVATPSTSKIIIDSPAKSLSLTSTVSSFALKSTNTISKNSLKEKPKFKPVTKKKKSKNNSKNNKATTKWQPTFPSAPPTAENSDERQSSLLTEAKNTITTMLRCQDPVTRSLVPQAQTCKNIRSNKVCAYLFAKVDTNTGKRDVKCNLQGLKDIAESCRQTCAICCEDINYSCEDDTNGIIDCSKQLDKCQLPKWFGVLSRFCAGSCGLCTRTVCRDYDNTCRVQKEHCLKKDTLDYMRQNCARTCGFCIVGDLVDREGENSSVLTDLKGGNARLRSIKPIDENSKFVIPAHRIFKRPPRMGGGTIFVDITNGRVASSSTPECIDHEPNCIEEFCNNPVYREFMLKLGTQTCLKCGRPNLESNRIESTRVKISSENDDNDSLAPITSSTLTDSANMN